MRTSDPLQERVAGQLRAFVTSVRGTDDARHIQLLGTGAVEELESKLSSLVGMRYAVCVSSATAGLMMVALALGLRNRQFLTSPLGYGATLGGWAVLGNSPRFADVDPVTLGLDPDSVRGRAKACRRLGALLAVDLHGVPSDTAGLRAVANELGVPYVADAAQSLGARIGARHASFEADVLVTSFTSGKTLFAGEGGAVLTNDRGLYERLLRLGQHPYRQRRQVGLREWNECALNARIHPLAAIWANVAFQDSLERLASRRRSVRRAVLDLAGRGFVEPGVWGNRQVEPAVFRVSAALASGVGCASVARFVEPGTNRLLPERPLELLATRPEVRAMVPASQRDPSRCPVAADQARRRLVWRWADKC